MARAKKKKDEEKFRREEAESGKRVSGEPDSNLAAVGAGSITGAAAGATIGAAGGPLGAGLGAAAGAIIGGAIADQVQDELDPKLEEVYWQENYHKQPYYKSGDAYDVYLPAYRFGWESAIQKEYAGRTFNEIEPELMERWEDQHPASQPWSAARLIARDAFQRIRDRAKEKK
jgi:hypothetical protein